jgi:hypothetical protein
MLAATRYFSLYASCQLHPSEQVQVMQPKQCHTISRCLNNSRMGVAIQEEVNAILQGRRRGRATAAGAAAGADMSKTGR